MQSKIQILTRPILLNSGFIEDGDRYLSGAIPGKFTSSFRSHCG
ncbi:hypothetical protein [Komarekiella delphini-convector]|nr:hypothetical protein [Komarekiella delphini-convector]